MNSSTIERQKNKSLFKSKILLFFVWATPAFGANVYWTNGNGTGIWHDDDNWSTGIIPTSDDYAIFNGTHNDAVVITSDVLCFNLEMAADYTGTITQNAGITANYSYKFIQRGGSYIMNGDGILYTAYFQLYSGTSVFNAGGGTVSIYYYMILEEALDFVPGTSTVIWRYSKTTPDYQDWNLVDNTEFYNFTINSPSGKMIRINPGQGITVLNDLNLINGSFGVLGEAVNIEGDLTVGVDWDGGNQSIKFTGTATQYIDLTGATDLFNASIIVDKTDGEVILQSDLILDRRESDATTSDLTITNGIFNLNGYDLTVDSSVGCDFYNDGILRLVDNEVLTLAMDTNSGIIEYIGDGDGLADTYEINFDTYYNLKINLIDSSDQINIGSGISSLNVNGDFDLLNSASLFLNEKDLSIAGDFNNEGTLSLVGTETLILGGSMNSGVIEFVGNGDGLANTYYVPDIDFYNLKINFTDLNDKLTFESSEVVNTDDTNLVARWDFEDTAADRADNVWIARDRTGNGHDTTMYTGDPNWVTTTLPYVLENNTFALEMDGVDDALKIGDIIGFPDGLSDRSLCFWGNTLDITNTGWRWGFAYGNPSGSDAMFIGLNNERLYGGAYADDIFIEGFWDVTNEWHHVCLTYDGVTANLYGDGSYLTGEAKNWTLINNYAWIGSQVASGVVGSERWHGYLDDIRLYDKVLTVDEIETLSQGISLLPVTPIVDINNSLDVSSGIFELDGADLYLGGDLLNNGIFTHTSGTTYLDGTNQTITGANTFNNLSKIVTSTYTLTLPASATTTITGTTTWQGLDGARLNIRSSETDTQALMDPQGDRDIRYLDGKDNNNVNAEVFSCTIGCIDSGNLTNWTLVDPSIQVSISDATVDEGAGTVTFTTTLSGTPPGDATVDYYTSNNTATGGSDYAITTGTLTWATGTNGDVTTTISITDDDLDESSESFYIYLENAVNTNITDDQATVTITDNDDVPSFAVSDATIAEDGGNVTVSTTMTNKSGSTCTVDYATSDGTALSGSDYTSTTGTLSWSSGEDGAKTFDITILEDNTSEIGETITVTLSNQSCGSISDSTATITINPNDSPPDVVVSDTSGSEANTNISVSVTLTGKDLITSTIYYSTSDGTATAGSDYTAVTGTLTWDAGETGSKTFNIEMLGDDLDEINETVIVTLSDPVNVDIIDATATIIITDDDPTPAFTISDTSAAENNQALVTVSMSGYSAYTATVNYATSNGTSTAGTDYISTNGTLSWSTRETGDKTFLITLIDDEIDELDETINVALSDPNNGTISDDTGIVTILDNDGTPVLTVSDKSVSESTNATMFATMAGISASTTSVDYILSDITATDGVDYTITSGTLSWSPGETGAKTFAVLVEDDSLDEGSETALITYSSVSNATLSSSTAILTIQDNDPTPYFSASDVYAIESSGTSTASVYMHYGSASTVSVDYAIEQLSEIPAPGEAEAGVDYVFTSGTLTWAPGEIGNKTFDIGVLDDAFDEGQETANITLSNPVNATILDSSALLILDDDGTPGITITDKTVNENAGTINVVTTLSGTSANTTTVDWATADNTTTADSDYDANSGTVTWAPGESGNKNISITITNDTAVEGSESFYVNLSGATGDAAISDSQAEITINDNDGLPSLSISDESINEAGDTVTFTVTKSGVINQTVTVDYETANGTALTSDYVATSGTLTWLAGDSADKSINVNITDDASAESSEFFYINLSNAQNGSISDGTGTATIVDNDTTVSLSISDVSVNESAGNVNLTVTMTGYYNSPVTVNYDTSAVTASAGADYTTTAGTLTWTAGQTGDKTITVPIVNDPLDENSENFNVVLSNLVNCATDDDTASVTINDNDDGPTIAISDVLVNESAGTVSVNVVMIGQSASTVSVAYATINSTTIAGSDYTADSGFLNWTIGQTGLKTIILTIIDDSEVEDVEYFDVNLSAPLNTTISDSSATVSIIDDDGLPFVYFSSVTTTIGESSGTASAEVSISGAPTTDATVQYASSNNTALSGSDYTTVNGVLTWAVGSTSTKTISVPILNDTIEESDEIFILTLFSASNSRIVAEENANNVAIEDDDGILTMSVADVSVNEGVESVTVTISVSGSNTGGASVQYATSNDTALAGSDYYSQADTLTWASGDTDDKTVTIDLFDDQINEGTETFVFTLSGESNAYVSDSTVTLTILDNDSLPSLSITDAEVSEGAGTADITVVMDGYYDEIVSVDYSTSNGTALSGSDYVIASDSVSWTAGETGDKTFTVSITDDSLNEDSETITLTISSPANATISDATATLTITDNDTPGISKSGTGTGSVTEGGSVYTYTLVLNTEPTDDVVVSISASFAQVGVLPITLTFTSLNWDTPQTVIATATDDEEAEDDESITITHAVVSDDADYNGAVISDITLAFTDDDTAGGSALIASLAPLVTTSTIYTSNHTVADGSSLISATKLTHTFIYLEFENIENATQVAASETKDFSGSSWVSYPTQRYNLKDKETDKLYFKFRSSEGGTTPIYVSPIKLASTVKTIQKPSVPTSVQKPTTPTTKHTFTSYLYIGSVGDEVRELQKLLEQLGYYNYPSITGYFGNVTKQSVVDFQKAKGLTPYPGWVGPGTRDALNDLAGVESKVVPVAEAPVVEKPITQTFVKPVFDRYMYVGSLGIQVRQLQQLLKDLGYFNYPQTTAYFGSVTKQAVMAFQKAKGITPAVGWVGPKTREVLNSL